MRYEQWFQLVDELTTNTQDDIESIRTLGLEILEKEHNGENVEQEWITWKEKLQGFMIPALKRRLSIYAQELDRLSMLNVEFD